MPSGNSKKVVVNYYIRLRYHSSNSPMRIPQSDSEAFTYEDQNSAENVVRSEIILTKKVLQAAKYCLVATIVFFLLVICLAPLQSSTVDPGPRVQAEGPLSAPQLSTAFVKYERKEHEEPASHVPKITVSKPNEKPEQETTAAVPKPPKQLPQLLPKPLPQIPAQNFQAPKNEKAQIEAERVPDKKFYQLLREAPQNLDTAIIEQKKELPFCVIISNPQKKAQIRESVQRQYYRNAKILGSSQQNKQEQLNYHSYKQLIKKNCARNTLILFAQEPLEGGLLAQLNDFHTRYDTWITYAKREHDYEVLSFYSRIYDLLSDNDPHKTNNRYLLSFSQQVVAMGLLELAAYQSTDVTATIDKSSNIRGKGNDPGRPLLHTASPVVYVSPLHINSESPSIKVDRISYDSVLRLSQHRKIDYQRYTRIKEKQQAASKSDAKTPPSKMIFEEATLSAESRLWEQLNYLPWEHPLQALYDRKISLKHGLKALRGNQQPFCVTVININGALSTSLRALFQSIVSQQYQNFHIVFLDDNPSATNRNLLSQVLDEFNFPKTRAKMVQNLMTSFNVYNILNAAYNYCARDEVQVLFQGEQLIGRHALQILSKAFKANNDTLVLATRYKDQEGNIWPQMDGIGPQELTRFPSKVQNTRVLSSLRAWKVPLAYSIPLSLYKKQFGNWLYKSQPLLFHAALLEIVNNKQIALFNEVLLKSQSINSPIDEPAEKKSLQSYKSLLSQFQLTKAYSSQKLTQIPAVIQDFAQGKSAVFTQLLL